MYKALVLFLLLTPVCCFAAQNDSLSLRHLAIENGLSNNLVRCIFQDKNGFLWFGTRDGLNRFDGYNFKVFRNKIGDPYSLGHNIIHAIGADRKNNIWIGTRQGVDVYNNLRGNFHPAAYLPAGDRKSRPISSVIRDIIQDRMGTMLIATESLGLLAKREGDKLALQIPLYINGVQIFKYGVQTVRQSDDGRIWVFAQNVGLCMLDKKQNRLNLVNNSIALALSMVIQGKQVWIGTPNGLYKYDTAAGRLLKIQESGGVLNRLAIQSLSVDKNGTVLIGSSGNGIYAYDWKHDRLMPLPIADPENGLWREQIFSIYIDQVGRKWIGTSSSGVAVIDPFKPTFATRKHVVGSNSLSGNAISAFYEAADHKIWIGTDGAGLSVWDRQTDRFNNYMQEAANPRALSSNFITAIKCDFKGRIWISTFTEGINRYDAASDSFVHYTCVNPTTGVESKVVFTLYQDIDHNLWAGTLRRGSLLGALYKLNQQKDQFELFDAALTDLFALREDHAGTLWAGNLDKLIKIDKIHKKHQYYHIGYTVRAIYVDRNGLLWIGTEGGGLAVFNPKSGKIIKRYTTADGLCNNAVLTLVEDRTGSLWMSTYNGLSNYNFKSGQFRNFYQSDGLQSNQFQINAGARLESGALIFGGIKGLNIFNPEYMTAHNDPVRLFLTSLTVNNRPIEQLPGLISKTDGDRVIEIKVPYHQAIFSFVFSGFEYSTPDKISFQYMMKGWDRGWTTAGRDRTATYTHIDPGKYTLTVKSTNSDGVWTSDTVLLKLTVLPPWYKSWPAYLGYLCILAAVIYTYQRYRTAKTRLKYEIKMANLEADKNRAEYESEVANHQLDKARNEQERLISEQERELNEKRMSFFTSISHEFRSPLSLIINPVNDLLRRSEDGSKDAYELNMVQRNARRMLSLVDQLLIFRKSDLGFDQLRATHFDFDRLSKDIFLCFVQDAASRSIAYEYSFLPAKKYVFADQMKVEIVIFNIISNALKYSSPGGKVSVIVKHDAKFFEFEVADNGPGIPDSAGSHVFDRFYQAERTGNLYKPGFGIGLYLAKQFVESHGGQINYENQATGGCIFRFTLPDIAAENQWTDQQNEKQVNLTEIWHVAPQPVEAPVELLIDTDAHAFIRDQKSILLIDDDADVRRYIAEMFKNTYVVYQAESGEQGLLLAKQKLPDLIITDYSMLGMDGLELTQAIRADPALSFIPIILLTASSSGELKLQSVHRGADDYINKPFEAEYLSARVASLLKTRNTLQNYFYNEITLQNHSIVISEEYKLFLDKCIAVVEQHINDPDFGIRALAEELGMSHSNLYKRVKAISGQSVNAFIRFIRLRKAAELMIHTDHNVTEIAFQCGFNDPKYFGKQFSRIFAVNPSEFIKKHRKSFSDKYKKK